MPSIENLIPDLASGAIVGFGTKPPSNEMNEFAEISGTCRIAYASVQIKATITPTNCLSCPSARLSPDFNGNYLHYQDSMTTVAQIDAVHPIVVSGNFSGCEYKVFNTGAGVVCTHIARPHGVGSDALVTLMDGYAGQKGWIQLQDIKTVGYIGGGCIEVIVVSQLRESGIDSILLKVRSDGSIMGTDQRTFTAL